MLLFSSADFFGKISFSKKIFQEYYQSVKPLWSRSGSGLTVCHSDSVPDRFFFKLILKESSKRRQEHCRLPSCYRPPDKRAYWKSILFISHPKYILRVLKRTVSMTVLWAPKTHVKIDGSKNNYNFTLIKVSKGAKIRNRYNQVPHLTQDTNGKVTNSQ